MHLGKIVMTNLLLLVKLAIKRGKIETGTRMIMMIINLPLIRNVQSAKIPVTPLKNVGIRKDLTIKSAPGIIIPIRNLREINQGANLLQPSPRNK